MFSTVSDWLMPSVAPLAVAVSVTVTLYCTALEVPSAVKNSESSVIVSVFSLPVKGVNSPVFPNR